MSKATVKMCVSTTGFGSQVRFAQQRQDDNPPILPQPSFDQHVPPPSNFSARTSRPPPQFDYDLKNLFSEDAQNGRMFSRTSQTWQAPLPSVAPNQAPTYAYAPSDASTPSTLSTATSNPNPNPKQSQMAHTNQSFDSSLLSNPFQSSKDLNNDPSTYDNLDFDFLINNDTTNTAAAFAGDVGHNLGLDGQLDWADGGGQLPDLFGNFFFGSQGGGEGLMDSGGSGGFGGVGGEAFDEGIWTGAD